MKFIKHLMITLSFFLTLFPINFIFFPSWLSTRLIIALLGLITVVKFLTYKNAVINYKVFRVIIISLSISLWSFFCTSIFNDVNDFTYVKHIITTLVILLSTYYSVNLLNAGNQKTDFLIVSKYFILAIILQSIITLIIFISPQVSNILVNIQRIEERENSIVSNHLLNQTRFIGFGLMFYTASFFYGTALILVAYFIRKNVIKNHIAGLSIYLFIAIIGIGLARSTMIGLGISLFYLLIPIKLDKNYFKTVIRFFCFSAVIILVFQVLKFLGLLSLDEYSNFINNAFEVFVNLFNEGEIKSNSASGTFDTLLFPKDVITYFFGTGFYNYYTSIYDFNYSDIGYLRLLYYSGFLGLFLFFIFEIYLLKVSFYNRRDIFILMALLLLITNVKGNTTLAVISMLYFWIPNDNQLK